MSGDVTGALPLAVLRERGITPRKHLGQNFLRDRSYLRLLLEAARVDSDDWVLELGAGTGVLTSALAERAQSVVAVELDDALVPVLEAQYATDPSIVVWHGSALDFDPCVHFPGDYKVVGNIPYYITGPIIRRYLEIDCTPLLVVLMVQREVAHRLIAKPGAMSLLAVSAQFYAAVELVAPVPAAAFYPRPKVDSAIVRLVPHSERPDVLAREAFFAVARAGFGMKRKQLLNSLSAGLSLPREAVSDMLGACSIDAKRRAETLSVAEWAALALVWRAVAGATQ